MQLPALHGNWVDLLVIFIVLFYMWEGVSRGFLLGLIDVAGFVLAFLGSLKFYAFLGNLLVVNFSLPRGISNAVGFLLAGVLTEFLLAFLINLVYRRFSLYIALKVNDKKRFHFLNTVDNFLGFVPAVMEGLIFTAFILTLFVALPLKGSVKKDILTSKLGGPLVARAQGVERQLNSIFGQAVSETLTFFTISPDTKEKINLGYNQNDLKTDEAGEKTMYSLLNEERVKAGLKTLIFNNQLRDIARAHAKDMFVRGYFSHVSPEGLSPFDRMKNAGIFFTAAGENLALAPNVYLAHQGLMSSPGHRANILSADFGKVGIGVIDGGIYGEMFVQEFTD